MKKEEIEALADKLVTNLPYGKASDSEYRAAIVEALKSHCEAASEPQRKPDRCGAVCMAWKDCGDREYTHRCLFEGNHEGDHKFPCESKPGEAYPGQSYFHEHNANIKRAEEQTSTHRDFAFAEDLRTLLNRYSKENSSDTPDFVLAPYLIICLRAFDKATKAREEWYGRPAGDGAAILRKDLTARTTADLEREVATILLKHETAYAQTSAGWEWACHCGQSLLHITREECVAHTRKHWSKEITKVLFATKIQIPQ
jgi:hypothetical protein